MYAVGIIIRFIGAFCAFALAFGMSMLHAFDADAEGRRLTAEATRYEHGEGVTKDAHQAYALYCEAAKLGHADAQYKLGWMIANGRGVARDNGLAATLFALAADQGHEHAGRMKNFMGRPGPYLPACLLSPEVEPILPPEPKVAIIFPPESLEPATEISHGVVTIDWTRGQASRKRVVDIVNKLAPAYGIDPDFALSIITIESAFDPRAKSSADAHGLMQLIPATAQRFGVANIYDPTDNVRGGLQYLRWLLSYFKGYVPWVAAAYNAGEGRIESYKGVPPFSETRRYVERLCQLYPKNLHPYDPNVVEPSRVATGALADSACKTAGKLARW